MKDKFLKGAKVGYENFILMISDILNKINDK